MSAGRWYVAGPDGTPHGPYDLTTLRSHAERGDIHGGTRLCAEGTQKWMPATTMPELGLAPAPTGSDPVGILIPVNVSTRAILAGWLGLFSIFCFPPIGVVAILLGVLELRAQRGRVAPGHANLRAWIGIICGAVGVLGTALILIAIALSGP